MSDEKKNMQSQIINPLPWIGLLVVTVLAVVGNYFINFHGSLADKPDTWGQFGDYVGGVLNPLLSFCAFVGLIFTLRFQHKEAIENDKRHNLDMRKSEDRYASEKLESRVFQLLGFMSASLAIAHIGKNRGGSIIAPVYGYPALQIGVLELVGMLRKIDGKTSGKEIYDFASHIFDQWSNESAEGLLAYFETVVCTVVYVLNNSEGETKDFLLSVVIAQLPQDARVILFLLLIFNEDLPRFRALHERNTWGTPIAESIFPHGNALLRELLVRKGESSDVS